MVSFQNVGKFILSGVDAQIPEGVVVGVIGASGAGKTTLLKLACGLLESEHGIVRTLGRDPVRCRKEIAAQLRAYFSEHFYFDRDDTVLHQFQLLYSLERQSHCWQRDFWRKSAYSLEGEAYWEEYKKLADIFQISDYEKKRVSQLSLGQRRRVELASVLLGAARLLIFDEPTNGLDGQGRQAFWRQLGKKRDSGVTILISSHNMQEIGQLCDRVILLDKGRLLYYGGREEMLRQYAPAARIEVQFEGKIPDMEDLPLLKYSVEGAMLRIYYHAGAVTAAEIVQHMVRQTDITGISIVRQNLEDVILQGKEKV